MSAEIKDERFVDTEIDQEELARVQAQTDAKMMRHRLDDYVAMILGIGVCVLLWVLQVMGLY